MANPGDLPLEIGVANTDTPASDWLLCRVRSRRCALPVENVVEIMRPLPIENLPDAPKFVHGLAIIRGMPVVVVDAGLLLSDASVEAGSFVIVRTGGRTVALAVDHVIGIEEISADRIRELPPLMRDAGSGIVSAITNLDAELLLLLSAARLVPEAFLAAAAEEMR